MRTRSTLIAFAPFLFALPLLAQTAEVAAQPALSPAARAIVAASRESSEVMDHLDYLTNAIGPRLTGSEALVRACEWAAHEFERIGLQDVHLERWGEVPVTFERGPWFGALVRQDGDAEYREVLEFNTPAWSAGTRGLQRGRAVRMPTTEAAFAACRDQLRGAWLVLPAAPSARGPRGAARPEQESAFDALRACADAGIAGVVRASRDEYLRTGSNRDVDWRGLSIDALPTRADVQLTASKHAALVEMLEQGDPVDLEFNIQNRFRPGPVGLYNVVADIRGRERPDEFVLVGGHIDCWDGSTGAVDNASGCATAIEAARLIVAAGVEPKRTIRFVLWSGEEQGLLGSSAYVRQHAAELPKISAYLNHDSGTNWVSGLTCTDAMRADLERAFAGVGGIDDGMDFAIQVTDGLRGGGSDHSSFLRAGVPAWSWRLTGDHPYGHIWHTQHDLYDEVVAASQRHSAMVIAIGAVGIADLDGLLSRDEMTPPEGDRRGGGFNIGVQLDGGKVVAVQEGGFLSSAGFEVGDQLLKVGDQEVSDLRGLFAAVRAADGEAVEVTVRRGGEEVKLKLSVQMRRRR